MLQSPKGSMRTPRRRGSLTMLSAPDSADVVSQEQPRGGPREIIDLVKRSSYTLAIATPRPFPTGLSWAQAMVQARLTQRGALWACVLNPPELEAFYEDLRGLVEYLRARRGQPSAISTREPL
jgi:hypothetical protein